MTSMTGGEEKPPEKEAGSSSAVKLSDCQLSAELPFAWLHRGAKFSPPPKNVTTNSQLTHSLCYWRATVRLSNLSKDLDSHW